LGREQHALLQYYFLSRAALLDLIMVFFARSHSSTASDMQSSYLGRRDSYLLSPYTPVNRAQ
jgi:hypothetical protein